MSNRITFLSSVLEACSNFGVPAYFFSTVLHVSVNLSLCCGKKSFEITPVHLTIFITVFTLLLSECSLDVLTVFIIYQNPNFGNAIELALKFTKIISQIIPVSLSVYLFPYLYTCFPICIPVSLSVYLFPYLYTCFLICIPVSLSVYLFPYLYTCFLICIPVSLSVFLFPYLYSCFLICIPVSLSVYLFPYLYTCFLIYIHVSIAVTKMLVYYALWKSKSGTICLLKIYHLGCQSYSLYYLMILNSTLDPIFKIVFSVSWIRI